MAYQEKVVGAVCSSCKQGKYVRNPKTQKVFCDRKCWLNGTQTPVQAENAPQANFEANYASLSEKVATLEMAMANMRVWASKMEKRVSGLETLDEGKALDLHQSFVPRDIHEAKDIVENGIPVINQVPEGFDK